MAKRIALLSDSKHINKKNFNKLLNFLSANKVDEFHMEEGHPLPIDANGEYGAIKLLEPLVDSFRESCDDLVTRTVYGVNIFDVCRAELLSYILPKKPEIIFSGENKDLFILIKSLDEETLLRNLSSAKIWIEFWWNYLNKRLHPAYILIFSGSSIYARALLEVSKFCTGRVFVLESFFTGLHFYCEERFQPIANNSDLQFNFNNVCKNFPSKNDKSLYLNKFLESVYSVMNKRNNKNVKQPAKTGNRVFSDRKNTVLLLGQVLNDFSLLEYRNNGLNSIEFYKRIIDFVLSDTNFNIIFKAHPWERQKFNLKEPFTLNYLENNYRNNPRVALLENHSINELFCQVNCVITINSQSGIEAAYEGFRPLQAGDAFWGNQGFSFDVDLYDMESIGNFLRHPDLWHLSISDYDNLLVFLVSALCERLIPEKDNNMKHLQDIFYEPNKISKTPARYVSATARKNDRWRTFSKMIRRIFLRP